jgi:hypothetical protein
MAQHHITAGGRYPVLRTIAILWLFFALLMLIGGIYQAIVALLGEPMRIGDIAMTGRSACLVWLSATFFVVILSVAISELIKLAIDVEHNTRVAAQSGATDTAVSGRVGNGKGNDEESAEVALIRGH